MTSLESVERLNWMGDVADLTLTQEIFDADLEVCAIWTLVSGQLSVNNIDILEGDDRKHSCIV